jgi:hypothetical protein
MLWSDTPNFSELVDVKIDDAKKGANARLSVQPKTTNPTEANAVYGLWIGGVFRWSWHIWISNASDPTVNGGSVNGLTFMSQNLGARPTLYQGGERGLLYQWGRKDPFPGAAVGELESEDGWDFSIYQPIYDETGVQINGQWMPGTEPVEPDPENPDEEPEIDPENPPVEPVPNPAYAVGVEVAALPDVTDAVMNPMVFSSNWAPTASNLWNVPFANGEVDRKSPYDPCPQGWRVARSETNYPWYLEGAGNELGNYSSQTWNNGIVFDNENFNIKYYPMTNYRKAADGAFDAENQSSSIWHGGIDGNSWVVDATSVNNVNNANLGNGMAVRCVQDDYDLQTW